jgi:hypothetical protein
MVSASGASGSVVFEMVIDGIVSLFVMIEGLRSPQ